MLNKVQLIGRLGRDPDIRYTQDGACVANLAVATSESYKDKESGERKENTEWHRVVLFRRIAEIAGEYLKKGSQVYLEGRLRTRKWQNKEGHDQYTTEIVGTELKMLGSRSDSAGSGQAGAPSSRASQQKSSPSSDAASSFNDVFDDGFDDDIPF